MYASRTRVLPIVTAFLVLTLSLAATRRAGAQEGVRLQVNWAAFTEAYRALASGASDRDKNRDGDGTSGARVVSRQESPWLGGGVVISLLARDWQGATRLVGGPLAVTDALRTSRSSRMVVARIGLGGGRIVPFIHIGAGQWRDPNPHLWDPPLAIAGEAGGGFEARVTQRLACALEFDHTTLYQQTLRGDAVAGDDGVFAVARLDY